MSAQPFHGRGLSLWWLPPPALSARLQGIIDALAGRLGTPSFPPHVTVEAGLSQSPDEIAGLIDADTSARTAPELRAIGIGTGPSWNHLLAVDLSCTEAVTEARFALSAAIRRTVAQGGYAPHLSLAYGPLDEARRQELAQALVLDLPPFFPVALALVDTRGQVSGWWETHRWPLVGVVEVPAQPD